MLRAILTATFALTVGSAAGDSTRILAVTGDAIPDGEDTFRFFDVNPVINARGDVAFRSTLLDFDGIDDDVGLFVWRGGEIATVARHGQAAPGGAQTFTLLEAPLLDDDGELAFAGSVSGTLGPRRLFAGDERGLTEIARTDLPSPDGNGTIAFLSEFTRNDAGKSAIRGLIHPPPAQGGQHTAVLTRDDELKVIARTGQPLPGGGGLFGAISEQTPLVNTSGSVLFRSALTGTPRGTQDDEALFVHDGVALTTVAREFDSVPEGNGRISRFSAEASINADGWVAFAANLSNVQGPSTPVSAIYLHNGENLTKIARTWDNVPSGNAQFANFSRPHLNDNGQMAFLSQLFNTSGGGYGIFLADGSTITEVARRGQPAPGTSRTFGSITPSPSLNNRGQISFTSELAGGSGDAHGVFLYDPLQGLLKVVATGDSWLGSTVEQAFTLQVGFNDPEQRAINDLGQVAFWFKLADDREGIAVWRPTPTGDFDLDYDVDRDDLSRWLQHAGETRALLTDGDADGDHNVDGADFLLWQRGLGAMIAANAPQTSGAGAQVPEPGIATLVAGACCLWDRRPRRHGKRTPMSKATDRN